MQPCFRFHGRQYPLEIFHLLRDQGIRNAIVIFPKRDPSWSRIEWKIPTQP